MPKVKNVKIHYHYSLPQGDTSWRHYWERKTNQHFTECANSKCRHQASVGGTVQMANGYPEVFIVPLCVHCQHPANTDTYEVNNRYLVKL